MSIIRVEKATDAHSSILVDMLLEFARIENLEDSVATTPQKVADDLRRGAVHGLILFENNTAAAMMLYHYAYSSWVGKFIHMEDLYVRPEYRRKGYGRRLWKEMTMVSKAEGLPGMQWFVRNSNASIMDFYKKMPIKDITTSAGFALFTLNVDGINLLDTSV